MGIGHFLLECFGKEFEDGKEFLELELETQMKICTKLVTGIYKCKNSDELQRFINTIL